MITGIETVAAIGSIVLIDVILGGDNAILIALASKNLSAEQQKKARIWGVVGAVGVRAVLTSITLYLLKIPLLLFVGGAILLWIAVKLLVEEKEIECRECHSLGEAIKIIIVADLVMGIDNMIAVAGAAHGSIIMVILGLLISVPIIVWGSTIILKWMEKYPVIIYIGGGVLAWTAGQMMASDTIIISFIGSHVPYFNWLVPTISLVIVLAIGYFKNRMMAVCKLPDT